MCHVRTFPNFLFDMSTTNTKHLLLLTELSVELVRADTALNLGARDESSSVLAIVSWQQQEKMSERFKILQAAPLI